MSDKRIIDIYYDIVASTHRDSNGDAIRKDKYPYILYKEKPLVNLRLVTDDSNTAYTGVAATNTFSASVDYDFDHTVASPLMCKTEDAGINVDGDFAGGNANVAQGQFSIRLDAYNSEYQAKIATSEEKKNTKLEILGFEQGTGDLIFAVRMLFRTFGIQDDSGSVPPEPEENYWTKTESDARYKISSGEYMEWFTEGGMKKLRFFDEDHNIVGTMP